MTGNEEQSDTRYTDAIFYTCPTDHEIANKEPLEAVKFINNDADMELTQVFPGFHSLLRLLNSLHGLDRFTPEFVNKITDKLHTNYLILPTDSSVTFLFHFYFYAE